MRKLIGNRIYGCDDCLAVCPWNKLAKKSKEISFYPRDDLIKPDLSSFLSLTDEDFRKKFSKSSIKRIGRFDCFKCFKNTFRTITFWRHC